MTFSPGSKALLPPSKISEETTLYEEVLNVSETIFNQQNMDNNKIDLLIFIYL